MATKNSLHADVYDAIDPKNFVGKLKGKVVLVTGAGQGIGQGIAFGMAKAGATLALFDLTVEKLENTVKQCKEFGAGEILPLAVDVTDFKAVDQALSTYVPHDLCGCEWGLICRIEKKLGEIDVLVNNAGTNRRRPFHMMTFDQFWKVIEVNFKAVPTPSQGYC